MNIEVLQKKIACPYCHSKLKKIKTAQSKNGKLFGYVECECDSFPIVCNILFLKKSSNLLNKKVVKLIKQNQILEAVKLLIDDNKVVKLIVSKLISFRKEKWLHSKFFRSFLSFVSNNSSWFEYLNTRNTNSADFNFFNQKYQKTNSKKTVLDIGCGNFFMHSWLPKKTQYIGIEIDFLTLLLAELLSLTKSQNKVLICSDVNHGVPVQPRAVDTVVFLDSFAYIFCKNSVMKSIEKILKSGYLYIIGMYKSNNQTDQWGYGISVSVMEKLLKQVKGTATFFHSTSTKKISSKNEVYYSVVLKK